MRTTVLYNGIRYEVIMNKTTRFMKVVLCDVSTGIKNVPTGIISKGLFVPSISVDKVEKWALGELKKYRNPQGYDSFGSTRANHIKLIH